MDKPLFAKERDMMTQNNLILKQNKGHFCSVHLMAEEIRKRINYDKKVDDQKIAERRRHTSVLPKKER